VLDRRLVGLEHCIASTLEAVVEDTMHNREEDAGRQPADLGHKDKSGDLFDSLEHVLVAR
jgi:hypothetical protein